MEIDATTKSESDWYGPSALRCFTISAMAFSPTLLYRKGRNGYYHLEQKHVHAGIDIRRKNRNAMAPTLHDVIADFADIVNHTRHGRRHEFWSIVDF